MPNDVVDQNSLSALWWRSIEYLKDSNLVADFQNYFGVYLTEPNHVEAKCDQQSLHNKPKSKVQIDADVVPWLNGCANGVVKEVDNNYKDKLRSRRSPKDTNVSSSSGSDDSQDSDMNNGSKTKRHIIKNKFWYYFFCFGASLGYELFYASFFPIWFWNIDGAVGRRMILVWVIIMYVGQALKDVIRWPRPSSPPVVVLEPDYAIEYGMPSTHAMVGAALPSSMIIFTMNRYDYPIAFGIIGVFVWCLLVCGSRLYLGMHSYLDIIAGLFLTGLMMIIIIPLVDAIDQFHLTSPYSPFITIPLIVLLSIFYPKSDRWSPARGDTCIIMGSGAGILLGSWLNYQLGIIRGPGLPPPFPIIWPGHAVIGLSLLRASIGILCIVAARAIGKVVVFSLLCYIRNLDPQDPKTKLRSSVEIPCKVITYMSMGFTITYLSPVVFRMLNIERVTMFTEV